MNRSSAIPLPGSPHMAGSLLNSKTVPAVIALLLALAFLHAHPCASEEPGHGTRIVSLAPSFTEILYAIGAGPEVIGTTTYCDYPAEALKTVKVGDMMNPNVEKIISLKPNIVFAGNWKWEVPSKLRKVGIRVVEIDDAVTLSDSLERIRRFGKELQRDAQAEKIT